MNLSTFIQQTLLRTNAVGAKVAAPGERVERNTERRERDKERQDKTRKEEGRDKEETLWQEIQFKLQFDV